MPEWNPYKRKKHTYIEIEAQSNANVSSLKRDLNEFDIYSNLYKDVNTDHNVNYELFSKCVCLKKSGYLVKKSS